MNQTQPVLPEPAVNMRPGLRRVARAFTALYLLQTLLAAVPAAAQLSAAPGAPAGQKPLIDAAANGVPLVHIAPPSAAGVSRNQYGAFNVGPNGLILNNATGNVQTQLGGWIKGNLQLGSTPARIILNEVTGSSASQLRGVMEVGGQKADVVVANPNGISCDGCGFINTSRATLSTGVPMFGAGGALTGFDVRAGVLNIGPGGLSTTSQQQLDLYARGLVVEGELWAQNLQALIGANQVTHGAAGQPSQAAPGTPLGAALPFAVDIKALGGMYAGSIYLIATEKGLGVNSTGRLSTLAGDLMLSANGELTIKDSYSARNSAITATGPVSLTGQNQAEGSIRVQGQGVSTAGASVFAPSVAIDAGGGALNNAGGSVSANALSVTNASQLNNRAGTIYSQSDLSLHTGALDTRQGFIGSGGALDVTATQLQAGGATLASGGAMNLSTAGAAGLAAARVDAGGKLAVAANSLDATGASVTGNGDIAVSTQAAAALGGSAWSAQGNLTITSRGALDAANATVRAGNAFTAQANGITTSGGDVLVRILTLDAGTGDLNNAGGKLQATGSASVVAQGVNNSAGTIAANGDVSVNASTGALSNTNGQIYSAQGQTRVTAAHTNNTAGVLAAATTLTLQGGEVNNTEGVISGAQAVAVNARGLINDAGVIESGAGGMTIDTQGQALRNMASGSARGIVSAGDLSINAGPLDNASSAAGSAAYIGASGNLSITSSSNITNTAGAVITSAATSLAASGDVTNAGLINSTSGDTRITAANLRNTGRIYGDSVSITAATTNSPDANGAGAVIASRNGDLAITGPVSNTGASLILSLNDLSISGATANDGSVISAARNLSLGGPLSNTNAALSLTTVTSRDTTGGSFIRPANSATTYARSELLYTARDSGFYILTSATYPLARFGGEARALMSDCVLQGDYFVCGNNYSTTDPIWPLMNVASPGPGPGAPPQGCASDIGDGGFIRVTSGSCGGYWSSVDAFQASLPAYNARLDAAITAFNSDLAGRTINNWYELTVTAQSVAQTAVTASKPGQVLAGGNMTLAGGRNQDSVIVAGGNLDGGALQNAATQGSRQTTQEGTMVYSWGDYDNSLFGSGFRRNYGTPQPIADAPVVTTFDLPNVKYLANTSPASVAPPAGIPSVMPGVPGAAPQPPLSGSTLAATARALQQGTGLPAGAGAPKRINAAALAAAEPAEASARRQGVTLKAEGYVTVTAQGSVRVPASQLFNLNRAPSARYLVETDPAFMGYRQWLSSDYFTSQLALDADRSFKRYGDGFAEQRLIDDQILALTGRRFLSGYSATEAEYQDLLDAGVQYARQFQLSPGVALSAAQMASLTSDIVWLELKAVTLADGSTVQALVPTVYLRRPVEGDLSPGGSLIAGGNVTLRSAGDLTQGGSIVANGDGANGDGRLLVEGRNVTSTGTLAGNTIRITAGETINSAGGTIQGLGANSSAALNARDIILRTTVQSTSREVAGRNGTSTGTATNADRIATVNAASITLAARNNIDLKGATVKATGDLSATAGGSITSDAVQTGYTLNIPLGGSNSGRSGYSRAEATTQQLTTLKAGGDIKIEATGDASFKGTNADAGNNLSVQARNIGIEAAKEKLAIDQQDVKKSGYDRFAQSDESLAGGAFSAGNNATLTANGDKAQAQGNITVTGATVAANAGKASLTATHNAIVQNASTQHSTASESYASSKSFLSKGSTAQSSSSQVTQAEASNILGNTIAINAGTDATVQASQLNAQSDLQITAGRDVNITTAAQTASAASSFEQKKSGLSASFGQISLGKSAQGQTQAIQATTQAGSTISGANVSITAGRDATLAAATVLADQDIDIQAGRNLALNAAANTEATQSQAHSSSTVIGLAPTGLSGRFTAFGKTSSAQNADTTSTTQSRTLISANSGNVTLTGGADAQYRGTGQGNVTAQGADILAKGSVTATGNAVDLGTAQDSNTSRSHQESKSISLGSQLTGAIGGAVTQIGDQLEGATQATNSRLQGALALKAGYDAWKLASNARPSVEAGKATEAVTPRDSGFGVSIGVSSSKSSQDQSQSGVTNRGTSIQANAINITSRDGDVSGAAAKLQASDITLDAAGNLKLGAAANTTTLESRNQSSSSGVGVTLGSTGSGQNGISLQASAGKSQGSASGSETTWDNTVVTASNQLTIKSQGDANLQGAQLAANTVKADIKGNLNVETLQDQSQYNSKQSSSGFNISLCIPPLCGGPAVTGGVSESKQTLDHSYQSATGQSGIAAGAGGYDITVKGNTDLKGGAITSEASKENNKLVTGSLTYTDLENKQTTNASSSSTSLGYNGTGGVASALANNVTANVLGNLQGNAALPKDQSQTGKTQSVISPGNVTITGDDEASKQAAATLTSGDAGTANGSLKNTLTLQQAQDLAQKQKDQQDNQRAAELVGAVITNVIGDLAAKQGWGDNSAQKLALHGIAGLVQAKVSGGNTLASIAGGVTQEALAPLLAAYLEANGILPRLPNGEVNPDYRALMQAGATLAGAAVGAVAGGTHGAATGASVALTGVTNNYLNHQQWNDLANALGNCKAKSTGCSSSDEAAIRKTYGDLSARQNAALATCTTDCDQLKKEVADGTDAMLLLIGQGKLPGITGATVNDLGQNIGQNLANNSTLRAQVSHALVVKALCEINPSQCEKKALVAAALVTFPLLGYAGGVAALEFLIATGRVAATELSLFNSMGPAAYCGMNPTTCLAAVEVGTGAVTGAVSPSALPLRGPTTAATKTTVKSAGTVVAEVEVIAAKAASTSTVVEAGLPSGFKSFNIEGLPTGSRGVVETATGEVRILTAAGKLTEIPSTSIPANINATVVPLAATGIKWGGGIQGQGLPFEDYLATKLSAERLPPNFKTFDFIDRETGLAISAKTLNTMTDVRIADPTQLFTSIKGNVDTVLGFDASYTLSRVTVDPAKIYFREIQLAVPASTTPAQWEQIKMAIQYGESKKVTIKITVVK